MTTFPHRPLLGRHVAMISIGGVIGAGFFVASSGAIADAGEGVLVTYLLSGIVTVLFSALLTGLMRGTRARGTYILAINEALGPRLGFIAGWTFWVIWIITLAIETIGASTIVAPLAGLPFGVCEALILGSVTVINLCSPRSYAEVEYGLSMLKILGIAGFCALGLFALSHGSHHIPAPVAAQRPFPHGWFSGLLGILAAMPTVTFSMSGTETATIAALESTDFERQIARQALGVAARVVGLYLTSITVLLLVLPLDRIVPGHSPFLTALNMLGYPLPASILGGIIVSAMVSTLNSGLYAASRVLAEMADRRDAPLVLARPRTHGTGITVPRAGILLCAAATVALAAIATLSPGGVFAFLASAAGGLTLFQYALVTIGGTRVHTGKTVLRRYALGGPMLALILLVGGVMAVRAESRFELIAGTLMILGVSICERLTARWRDSATVKR